MYFAPSEHPVTPSNSPVMWGYATTPGVHMPMVHLADSSQTKITTQKQPKIAYFTPPGQNFLRLRRAYKALRVGGTAGPGPPRASPSVRSHQVVGIPGESEDFSESEHFSKSEHLSKSKHFLVTSALLFLIWQPMRMLRRPPLHWDRLALFGNPCEC